MAIDRPRVVEEGHLQFLDELRATGLVGMFGAGPHLVREFPSLTLRDAHIVLQYWMESFSERHPE